MTASLHKVHLWDSDVILKFKHRARDMHTCVVLVKIQSLSPLTNHWLR